MRKRAPHILLLLPTDPSDFPPPFAAAQRHGLLLRTRTVGQMNKVRLRDHVTTVNTGACLPRPLCSADCLLLTAHLPLPLTLLTSATANT